MSTNRYTNLSYSNLNDLPLLSLPFEQLQGVLSASQQAKDQFDELSGLTPKYIQNSPSDVQLAGTVKQYQNDLAVQLADIAASGDANKYRRELANARRNIVKMWQPGGAAHALETRYAEDLKDKETVRKAFENAPRIGEYILGTKQYNDVNYNAAQGTYSNVSRSTYHRNVEEKEINDWFDKNLGNVKDSLLNEGYSKKQIDGITTMHDFWKTEGVPFNKLVDTFTKLFPQEYASSIYQREAANRYYNPSLPPISPNIFQTEVDKKTGNRVAKLDNKGRYVLNTDNPIAAMIQGYSQLGERVNLKHDRKFDNNEIALERAKLRLKREEEAAEYTPRHQEVINQKGITPISLDIDEKGFVKSIEGKDMDVTPSAGGMAFNLKGLYPGSEYGGIKAIDLFKNGTIAKQIPEATAVYNKYKNETWFRNLDDKKKAEILIEATNKVADLTRTTSISVNFPEGAGAKKTIEEKSYRVIGKGNQLGDIQNRPVFVLDGSSISSEPMTVDDIIDQYFGGDKEKFTAAARVKGDVRGDNFAMPSGDYIQFTVESLQGVPGFRSKKNKTITILASEDNRTQMALRTPIYMGNAVRFGAQDKSYPFQTGIGAVDNQYPSGIQTQRVTIFKDEDYDNQAREIEAKFDADKFYIEPSTGRKITNRLEAKAIADEYRGQASYLRKSPKENNARFSIQVLDAGSGQVIGNENFWNEINGNLENEASKYER